MNVFIGANGSGKSNILEAVGFLSAAFGGGLEAEAFRYRGVRLGRPSSFVSNFNGLHTGEIELKLFSSNHADSIRCRPDEERPSRWLISNEYGHLGQEDVIFESEHTDLKISAEWLTSKQLPRFSASGIGSSAQMVQALAQLARGESPGDPQSFAFRDIADYAIFTPNTQEIRGLQPPRIMREPLGLDGSGLASAIHEMLAPNSDQLGPFDLSDVYELIEWANGIEVDNHESRGDGGTLRLSDRFLSPGRQWVSLNEASEGALYVLFLLALVGNPESPRIFAVDNLDQALHPRAACALTRLIAEQVVKDGKQMLATTHNPLVLDGLDLLNDQIRLFVVERGKDGATTVNRVQVSEELMAQADQGLSLSRLWLMGRLGGVPKYL